uniref:G-protein coupled receptors family 1 profile domain-containing protein n=1 Tax=Amazona collaria TaxID=241587 RepID=A0A8B9FWL8_9PSIT
MENQTEQVTELTLVGLTDNPRLQALLFILFLLIYFIVLVGNLGMVVLIRSSAQLQSPMYFFLSNLSLLDACYSSVVAPKTLKNLLMGKKTISVTGCASQLYFFIALGTTVCFLLAAMPLLYSSIMSHRVCMLLLVTGSYLMGLTNGVGQTISMSTLSFCSSSTINLFFCDIAPLISLSSSDTTLSHIILTTAASLFGVSSILVILLSYVAIITTILSINSAKGKRKAFSTCTSHLTTVSIFYGACFFMYLNPSSDSSRGADKWAVVLYTMVTPMLNPLIYSLRNKEVKEALRRLLKIK